MIGLLCEMFSLIDTCIVYRIEWSFIICLFTLVGNVDGLLHQQLIPMPKQFTEIPAIAAHCKIHGLADAADETRKQAAVDHLKVCSSFDFIVM